MSKIIEVLEKVMAHLNNKALFFTTSPRSPAKMIPEIHLLHKLFNGKKWNKITQVEFINCLAKSDFFEGYGSQSDQAFSARDRINRAPKALGFVDLHPKITLTEAGKAFIFGKRPQEVFLRQLLKFQLPSPYHVENEEITGTFCVRPYLEIMRLVRKLKFLTFDELKIFAIQLTDYRNFDKIKNAIVSFRAEKKNHKSEYKKFANSEWTNAILTTYNDKINKGKTKTRGTADASLKKFLATKKSNLRDYADACFRYLRYTGLVSISHRDKSISFFQDKLIEVDYILSTVERNPVFVDSETVYKAHLFSATTPSLYVDEQKNIVDTLMHLGCTRRELAKKSIEELKDLRDQIIEKRKDQVINAQIEKIKSYDLYSEIIDTYNEIISDEYYDAPLMFEYNTWRAMTMLNGGKIKGNFKFDDAGHPLSTAQGNMPDIECDYNNFALSVEVTLQSGQRQYEAEGESVARHYGQLCKRTKKDTYCLFIAPTINAAAWAHFFTLTKTNIAYYAGKSKIIPLELDQFMKLVENSYSYVTQPSPRDVRRFLDSALKQGENAANEDEWREEIQKCVTNWLVGA